VSLNHEDKVIWGDSGGKVNILGGDSISQCERKSSYELGSHSEFLLK
jgi:hypothetical protein